MFALLTDDPRNFQEHFVEFLDPLLIWKPSIHKISHTLKIAESNSVIYHCCTEHFYFQPFSIKSNTGKSKHAG